MVKIGNNQIRVTPMTLDSAATEFDSFWGSGSSSVDGSMLTLTVRDDKDRFILLEMTREEQSAMLYAIQKHGPAKDCPRCGNNSYRVVPEKRGPHFGTVECARCGRFIRWASRKEALKAAGAPQVEPAPLIEALAEYQRADATTKSGGREG